MMWYCIKCEKSYNQAQYCCGRRVSESVVVSGESKVSGTNQARDWRVERYLELGFETVQAEMLADARAVKTVNDKNGVPRKWDFPLQWQTVEAALQAGCTLDTAVAVFT